MGFENGQEVHEGEHYLNLIGLGSLANKDIVMRGVSRKARDFLEDETCAAEARPAFIGFESLSPDDPRRDIFLKVLQEKVAAYLDIVPVAET